MRRHRIALRHAVLGVSERREKYQHVLHRHCRHRIVRHRTDAQLRAAARAHGAVLHVQIGNLREELLHLRCHAFHEILRCR